MGYFDYLEESVASRRDAQFFDVYAKVGFWVGIGALGGIILSMVILFSVGMGKIIWLDLFPALSLAAGVVSVWYCVKTLLIARTKDKKSPLALMSLPWGILYILVSVILIVINTWVYFT